MPSDFVLRADRDHSGDAGVAGRPVKSCLLRDLQMTGQASFARDRIDRSRQAFDNGMLNMS